MELCRVAVVTIGRSCKVLNVWHKEADRLEKAGRKKCVDSFVLGLRVKYGFGNVTLHFGHLGSKKMVSVR